MIKRVVGFAALLAVAGLVSGLGASAVHADAAACGFDLFVLRGGVAEDVTNTPVACEFRPSWDRAGKRLVYNFDDGRDLGLLDLLSGATTSLPGTGADNNPSWSADGLIAFDRVFTGDSHAYVVSPRGGLPRAVLADAVDLSWSPDSERLAFVRPSDGSIGTAALDDEDGAATTVAPAGVQAACLPIECGLAWSPNGKLIAYSDRSKIWTVRVGDDGEPRGAPQLVSAGGPFFQTQLAWTPDSKTIVFNSDRAADGGTALWTVPAAGGIPERILGTTSQLNFDPAVSRDGAIAYSGSTP